MDAYPALSPRSSAVVEVLQQCFGGGPILKRRIFRQNGFEQCDGLRGPPAVGQSAGVVVLNLRNVRHGRGGCTGEALSCAFPRSSAVAEVLQQCFGGGPILKRRILRQNGFEQRDG